MSGAPPQEHKRLAIVGAGSSGLVALKNAVDLLLPLGWKITCFDQGERFVGCWGNPHKGFVSTSTKYTTQFACFQKYERGFVTKRSLKSGFRRKHPRL